MVAATRFFRNPKVKPAEILRTAAARTAEAAADGHVLLIQDTTEINYEAKAGRKRDLGTVGNGSDVGLFLHPALVVDADGPPAVLGLAGATLWRRTKTKATDYQKQPIETKESYRWIETAAAGRAALPNTPLVTVVADRECDIYEFLARVPERRADGWRTHVLIRCQHDRALSDKPDGLLANVAAWAEAGRIDFDLEARTGRPARKVVLAARFGAVTLRQPKTGADPKDPREITVNLVEVSEVDTPTGQEPVLWRIYTTHTVTTLDDARRVVELYRRRWTIEQVFRTLKSNGLDIENSLIADGEALENLAATAIVAAVQVMQCVHARGEAGADIPATRVFSDRDLPVLAALNQTLQGKTQKQKNPCPKESLAWAAWIIARLGGWKGYAKERPPGPITMRDGLQRFHAIAHGFALANQQ